MLTFTDFDGDLATLDSWLAADFPARPAGDVAATVYAAANRLARGLAVTA